MVETDLNMHRKVIELYETLGREGVMAEYGLSSEAARAKIRRAKDTLNSATKEPKEPEIAMPAAHLTKRLRALEATNRAKQSIINTVFELFRDEIERFAPATVPPPKIRRFPLAGNSEMHSIRSDEQVGQMVKPDRVAGLGNYNFEAYVQRAGVWESKILSFWEQDHAAHGLNKLVIICLGDHVEGEFIYKGQKFNIDMPLIDQCFESALSYFVPTILKFAQIFPEIEIFFVPGNHGRGGEKGEHSPETNWDYVYARLVAAWLRKQTNVSCYISTSPMMFVQHGQGIFAYLHGDQVRGYAGYPYYGMDRMFRNLQTLADVHINYMLVAHHHTPGMMAEETIANGTFVGGSDLSINRMGKTGRPSQALFYYHPKSAEIYHLTQIHLAEKPRLERTEMGGVLSPVLERSYLNGE